MVNVARYFLNFLVEESREVYALPGRASSRCSRFTTGSWLAEARRASTERIERLARAMKLGSLCELGKSAPNPVLSTLRYFKAEYEAHIRDKDCPAGVCRDLSGVPHRGGLVPLSPDEGLPVGRDQRPTEAEARDRP